jgi:hypothetical protein
VVDNYLSNTYDKTSFPADKYCWISDADADNYLSIMTNCYPGGILFDGKFKKNL